MKNSKMFMMMGMMMMLVVMGAVLVGGGLMMGKIGKDGPVTKAELVETLASPLATKLGDDLNSFDCNPFSDVTVENTSLRQRKSICYLYNKDLLTVPGNFTFSPKKYVNRAESSKLFMLVFSELGGDVGKANPDPAYTDIGEGDWFYAYVQEGAGVKNDTGVGIWDVPSWEGKKFSPQVNLTKSRLNAWVKKFKEALNYI